MDNVDITWRGMPHDEKLVDLVHGEIQKLDESIVVTCRVLIEGPEHTRDGVMVKVDLAVPHHEVHAHSNESIPVENAEVAVRTAFHAARQRLHRYHDKRRTQTRRG